MYEVEFDVNADMEKLFGMARIEGIDGATIGAVTGAVWNCVGAAPMKPLGFNPSYDQGARGPTPRVAPFAVERLTCTFPAFIVKSGDAQASRHFLTEDVTTFLEACVKLAARRPDLIPQATMGITVRRLFEENEPHDKNATNASDLYSAVDTYESVVVVYAGGDQSNYTVTFDVLKRPDSTKIEHYDD